MKLAGSNEKVVGAHSARQPVAAGQFVTLANLVDHDNRCRAAGVGLVYIALLSWAVTFR